MKNVRLEITSFALLVVKVELAIKWIHISFMSFLWRLMCLIGCHGHSLIYIIKGEGGK